MRTCPFNYSGSKSDYLELHSITEPVVDLFGGGGGFWSNIKSDVIIVNDFNPALIKFQSMIHKCDNAHFEDVIRSLYDITAKVNSREDYEELRKKSNDTNDPILFMAVLSTCTNNMIRFNLKGKSNQTWGKRRFNKNMEAKLRDFRNRIISKHVHFFWGDFENIKDYDDKLFFIDPPYLISAAGYNIGWNENDEKRLYNYLKNKRFIMTNFLQKADKTNTILEESIKNMGWYQQTIRSGKMKAQRKQGDEFNEILVADSQATVEKIFSKRLF